MFCFLLFFFVLTSDDLMCAFSLHISYVHNHHETPVWKEWTHKLHCVQGHILDSSLNSPNMCFYTMQLTGSSFQKRVHGDFVYILDTLVTGLGWSVYEQVWFYDRPTYLQYHNTQTQSSKAQWELHRSSVTREIIRWCHFLFIVFRFELLMVNRLDTGGTTYL